MRDKLQGDTLLLVTILDDIWRRYAVRVMAVLILVGMTVGGLVSGALWASRDLLTRTAGVIDAFQREIEHNREQIKTLEARQSRNDRRYHDLLIVMKARQEKGEKE